MCRRDLVNAAGHSLACAYYVSIALQVQGVAENIYWQNLLSIKYLNA
jgi:hypothetical protein